MIAVEGCDIQTYNRQIYDIPEKLACLYSHIRCIETAQKNDWYKVLVMEDDVIPCADFDNRLQILFNELPDDWDIAFLGFYPAKNSYSKVPGTKYIYNVSEELGAFAYIVRNSAYQIIIDSYKREWQCADTVLWALTRGQLKAYAFIPFFVYVTSDYSDLSRMNVAFPKIEELFKLYLQ